MIFDIFTFFNEVELLEIRLHELDELVDFFVICEGDRTHRGEPKPLTFPEHTTRFKPWLDRILYYSVHDFPCGDRDDIDATWCRELHQRDCIKRVLPKVKNDDIIVYGDADEIVRASILREYKPAMGPVDLEMRFFNFFLNYKSTGAWRMASIIPGSVYNSMALSKIRFMDRRYPAYCQPSQVLSDAGWHFSYLGSLDKIKYKLRSYPHWDVAHTLPALAEIQAGRNIDMSLLGRQQDRSENVFDRTEIDGGLPRWVQENADYYKSIGLAL